MILNHAPEQIECALLYDADFKNINFDEVLNYINTLIRAPGQSFQRSPGCPDTDFDMYHGHDMFIQISQNHRPLGPEGFADVLASPYTGMVFEDAERFVAKHKANIFITVTNKVPMPAEAIAMMEQMGVPYSGPQRREAFELKMQLCRQIASFIAGQRKPGAVHWCQSNSLLSGDMFLSLAEENDPTALHIHPRFVRVEGAAGEPSKISAVLHGAKMLINTDVVFAPTPMPPAYVFDRLMNFVDMVRLRDGVLIPDGESFGETAEEVIRVKHFAATAELPEHVELVLERHPDMDEEALPRAPIAATPKPVADDVPPMEPVIPKRKNTESAESVQSAPQSKEPAEVEPMTPAAATTESVLIGEYPAWNSRDAEEEPAPQVSSQKFTRANAPKAVVPADDKKPGLLGRLRSIFG